MSSDTGPDESGALRREMSPRDVVLFVVVAIFGIRWIAVAAGAGPSSLVVWIGAGALFFVPLIGCVLELGRRYPEEGGLYAWVKRAFGEYPAFITGWTYWTANLPYFPGLLYFAAGNALLAIPGGAQHGDSGVHVAGIALAGLVIAVVPNVIGMARGKWVQNIGAFGYWIPALAVIVLGTVMYVMHGSATVIEPRDLVPQMSLDHALAWSTIVFALGGAEGVSLVASQVRNPQRAIPRAVIAGGVIVLTLYLLGTLALLWAIPSGEISSIGGFVQAMQTIGSRFGLDGLGPVTAAFLAIGGIGGVGAWITATAQLPYVAGVDRYLPPRFGRLHPKYGTPHVAILTQGGIAALLIVVGQAGTTVRGAYTLLVAMSVISAFIPLLLMFAAAYRLAGRAEDAVGAAVPPRMLRVFGALGFSVILAGTLLALVPATDEPHPRLAVAKLLVLTFILLAAGTILYLRARQKKGLATTA